jgi:uncharacterized protein
MRSEQPDPLCGQANNSPMGQGSDRLPLQMRDFHTSKPQQPNRHWVRGDPFATALFNALSVVFPAGEAFMIRSIKPWQKKMPSELAQDVQDFVTQEAGHSREHDVMNQSLIEAGYDISPLERVINSFVARFKNSSDLTRLGVTMCIEHLTAIVAAELIKNDAHLADSNEELRELWIWHSVEEVEHKAVAFDVWHHATKDWSAMRRYLIRTTFLAAVTISFVINRTRGQLELLRQDGYGFGSALIGLMKSGFGRGSIGRHSIRPWLGFFRPGFHPWDIDDRDLLAKGEKMLAEIKTIKAAQKITATPAERRKRGRLARAA